MTILDYAIVLAYLLAMVGIGLYFQRQASKGIDAYFLAEGKLPWWALGASGMASNLDVSGTMINVAFIYALGLMGYFVEIRAGIVLIMAFLMTFMGKWNRRAEVMTTAEWMSLRFGEGPQGRWARLITAVAILLSNVAVITYFAIGAGKFIGSFLGIPPFLGFSSDFWAAALMIAISMVYTVSSGLYGAVWTEVFQGALIMICIGVVCYMAFFQVELPEVFSVSVPLRDGGFQLLETSRDRWADIAPLWQLDLPDTSTFAIYNMFGAVIVFYMARVIIDGAAGTGGYIIQRFYAAKSDREVGLMSLFWTVLLSFRWPFVAGLAMLGIHYGVQSGQVIQDPERVLPIVVEQMFPFGFKGLMVAGLMAAAMSTFVSIVNAGASYWVKDIYQAFLRPDATPAQLMRQSRWSSVLMVVVGLLLSAFVGSINQVYGWFTMSLGAGIATPLLLRWYWWRFNGYGFAIGTAVGMLASFAQIIWFADSTEYFSFLWVSAFSLTGCLLGTWLTPATEQPVLQRFYEKTRPFGFWSPMRKHMPSPAVKAIDQENRMDLLSVLVAVPWQLAICALGMLLLVKAWDSLLWVGLLTAVLSTLLYFVWYRRLDDGQQAPVPAEEAVEQEG